MSGKPCIGIIGGMGPHAGLDLHMKILNQTKASLDQDHFDIVHVAIASRIPDRTGFLLEEKGGNPAQGIFEAVKRLRMAGATVLGMPCNTAHAPVIFEALERKVAEHRVPVTLLNMPQEVARSLKGKYDRVGVLATNGSFKTGVHRGPLEAEGIEPVFLDWEDQDSLVQGAIYDPEYGIKAHPNPVTDRARNQLIEALRKLSRKGADCVLLACTELPIALPEEELEGLALIDATLMFARAMIAHADRSFLKEAP